MASSISFLYVSTSSSDKLSGSSSAFVALSVIVIKFDHDDVVYKFSSLLRASSIICCNSSPSPLSCALSMASFNSFVTWSTLCWMHIHYHKFLLRLEGLLHML